MSQRAEVLGHMGSPSERPLTDGTPEVTADTHHWSCAGQLIKHVGTELGTSIKENKLVLSSGKHIDPQI